MSRYPGAGGADGNIVSPQDSANYLLMLQDLRAALPDGALITLATQVWPFTGSNGSPLSNVKGFAAVIDWILIMNYDIWGCEYTLLHRDNPADSQPHLLPDPTPPSLTHVATPPNPSRTPTPPSRLGPRPVSTLPK